MLVLNPAILLRQELRAREPLTLGKRSPKQIECLDDDTHDLCLRVNITLLVIYLFLLYFFGGLALFHKLLVTSRASVLALPNFFHLIVNSRE